jgi:hypothetical protein
MPIIPRPLYLFIVLVVLTLVSWGASCDGSSDDSCGPDEHYGTCKECAIGMGALYDCAASQFCFTGHVRAWFCIATHPGHPGERWDGDGLRCEKDADCRCLAEFVGDCATDLWGAELNDTSIYCKDGDGDGIKTCDDSP